MEPVAPSPEDIHKAFRISCITVYSLTCTVLVFSCPVRRPALQRVSTAMTAAAQPLTPLITVQEHQRGKKGKSCV